MASLKRKRIDTLEVIALAASVGGFATFAPTPTVEVPKQIVLGTADLAMCLRIWNIYFDEEIDEKSMLETMTTKGIVAIAAGGTGYVIARGATGLLHELFNVATLPGWATSGLIAASATAALGLAWMAFCDRRYRNSSPSLATS